jgi:hypothetical protein
MTGLGIHATRRPEWTDRAHGGRRLALLLLAACNTASEVVLIPDGASSVERLGESDTGSPVPGLDDAGSEASTNSDPRPASVEPPEYLSVFNAEDLRLPRETDIPLEARSLRPEPDIPGLVQRAADLAGVDASSLEVRTREADTHFIVGVVDRPLLPPGTADASSEVALRRDTESLLELLGAAPYESDVVVSTLQAAGGVIGEPDEARDVFKKVYVSRGISGVPVAGDYLVVTFDLDGSFRKLVGTWRRVDGLQSQLSTSMSENEVHSFVSASLEGMNVPLRDSVYSIDLGTAYCSFSGAHENTWNLRVCVTAAFRDINGNGLGQEGKIPVYRFPLPAPER